MFDKLKQIQQLRTQAKQIKDSLSQETVEGIGANGQVKIIIDGNQEIKEVSIAQEILNDKINLEKAIKEAGNDAIKKVQKVMAQKMSQLGGFNFPGL